MPVPALMRCARPGIELAVVAFGVVVLEPAGEHPRDDLHVAVGVRRRTRCRRATRSSFDTSSRPWCVLAGS